VQPPRAKPVPATSRPIPGDKQDEFTATAALRDIHFDFARNDLNRDAQRVLDANIAWLKANPDALVVVEGHSDERGTNEYNLDQGEQRARAVMKYLVAHGIAPSRITVVSYGEERPVCLESTETCWARNRRAHFLVRHTVR
jgi:peptidoglycan-associated lipoprotein